MGIIEDLGEERYKRKNSKYNEKVKERRERVRKKTYRYDNGQFVVYVLKIMRDCDGEIFYYVGLSKNVDGRMLRHFSNREICMPSPGGRMISRESGRGTTEEYSILSVEETTPVEDRESGKEVERKKSYELAIEKNTTNILGG